MDAKSLDRAYATIEENLRLASHPALYTSQQCRHCVMDTTDPDIRFDKHGVCDYCLQYALDERQRKLDEPELPWKIYDIKAAGKNKKYDCILGLSGGVDSSLCLVKSMENGLRPLTFSIDNGWNTKEADENIMRLVEHYKVPFYRYTIDVDEFRKLQQAFIMSGTPNVEIPTDHILMASTYEMAHKYGIKYIISGGNLATESIMPPSWGYNARDLKFIQSVFSKYSGRKLKNLPTISLIEYLIMRFVHKIRIVNLLDYYEYNRENAKKELTEKVGWTDYGEKHAESNFTKWFQNMYLPRLWGYDKRKAHLSSLINSKQLTRDEALAELSKPLEYVELKFGDFKPDDIVKRHTHHDFTNSEWIWNKLAQLYANIK